MKIYHRFKGIYIYSCQVQFFITSFSEEDAAVIKSSLYFLDTALKTFTSSNDEEFINSIIQLVLVVLSKQSFSQDVVDVVASKLVNFLEKFSHSISKTKTLGKSEIQVH